MNYLVSTVKPWNTEAFARYSPTLPGHWHLISSPAQLTEELLAQLQPAMIFFPHWSWKVPASVHSRYPCVCFHMTDLPYGRGGSPLQNLIQQGANSTQLTALQMTDELDAGPIYAKVPLALDGSAQQIFERAAPLVYQLIRRIVLEQLKPSPQQGEVVHFTRRTPAQSALPTGLSAREQYDFIRMLDADSYPRAYLKHGDNRLELSDARLSTNGELTAQVRFCPTPTSETGASA